MTSGRGAAQRFLLIQVACLVFALVLVARLVHVQVIQHERFATEARQQWLQVRTLAPDRGDLFDRQGRPLALTVRSYRVGVALKLVHDRSRLAAVLAEVLAQDQNTIARRLQGEGHLVLSRQAFLGPDEINRLRRFPAVTLDAQHSRVYPLDGVAASLVGFHREDPDSTVHQTGLERGLDHLLVGKPGLARLVRSARPGEDHGEVVVEPVRHGADVVLTLDADLQEICESRLRDAVATSGAASGSVLVLDPQNGDLLAAASWPLLPTRQTRVADAGCWINRNVTAMYEPGSVFKIFTAASLLAHGAVDTATIYDCADTRFDGFRIREASGHHYGRLTFMEAFAQSSNVWFARAVANLDPEEHYRALLDFGFGQGTGVDYPAEVDGMLADPSRWSSRSQATIAIGQEVAVTPLQLGLAVAAVANGGTLYAPRLYREVRDSDGGVLQRNQPRPLRQVLPAGLDRLLRLAMRRVVTTGTGAVVDRPWIAIGGKTGTAQKSLPGRGYVEGHYTATFAGMLPVDDPSLVIVTVLDEPQGIKHYAAQSAAPLFAAVVDDIRRTTRWLTAVDEACTRVVSTTPVEAVMVPDVLYLEATNAALRLRQAGLGVAGAEQAGTVIMQVPAGGSLVAPGSTVNLTAEVRGGDESQLCPDLTGLSNRQVRALAARLGIPISVAGVGYVQEQAPAPGARITRTGLEVRMAPSWP